MSGVLAGIGIETPAALAPMAGITDLPFRRLAAGFGAGLVVSEMIASQEMVQGRALARARAALFDDSGLAPGTGRCRTAVQLAGRDARWMAEAARMAEDAGAAIIDINMGCPAKRVTSGWSGSALLREPDHALALIEAVTGAVRVPVTLKTRLGWDDACRAMPGLVRRALEIGVRMVALHGRTRCQFYRGQADWGAIGRARDALADAGAGQVALLANGDIDSPAAARRALRASGADGVMVGRAARGRPWLPGQIAAALTGRPVPPAPAGAALVDLVARHYEAMLSFYGRALGQRVARKHLGWYCDAADAPRDLRQRLLTAECPRQVLVLLPAAFGPPPRRAA